MATEGEGVRGVEGVRGGVVCFSFLAAEVSGPENALMLAMFYTPSQTGRQLTAETRKS